MSIVTARILVGCLLLFLGRRLFWVFVGAVGFVAGLEFAARYLQGQPDQVTVLFALAVGLVGALVALALRKLAITAAGFLAGGYLLLQLAATTNAAQTFPAWGWFLLGGVAGALLVGTLFDWALIVLSALAGATLISENLHLQPALASALFLGLTIVGVLAQAGLLRGGRRRG